MQTTTKPIAKLVSFGLDRTLQEDDLLIGAQIERVGPGYEATIEFEGRAPDPQTVLDTVGEAPLYQHGIMDRANQGSPLGVLVLEQQVLSKERRVQQGVFSSTVPGRIRARIEIFPYVRR